MKKALFSLTILALLIAGACSSDSNDPITPTCSSAINSLALSQVGDRVDVVMSATPGALYYEVSVQPANNSNINPEQGNITDLELTTGSITAYQVGNLIYYARTVCPDGTKGAWFGPKLLNIQPFCKTPVIQSVSEYGVNWSWDSSITTYQLQYGAAGFALGTGTIVNVNNNQYTDLVMAANQSYDFYVRPYCPASSGYGNWSTKYTYTATVNVNMCLAPSNIVVHYASATQISFSFNSNGENQWEYALTNSGNLPTQSEIHSLNLGGMPSYNISAGYHGKFYMRAVCSNGNRTAWVTLNI